MATHFSILAWEMLWTVKPGGLQSMKSQRVGHDWAHTAITSHWIERSYFFLSPLSLFFLLVFSILFLIVFNQLPVAPPHALLYSDLLLSVLRLLCKHMAESFCHLLTCESVSAYPQTSWEGIKCLSKQSEESEKNAQKTHGLIFRDIILICILSSLCIRKSEKTEKLTLSLLWAKQHGKDVYI